MSKNNILLKSDKNEPYLVPIMNIAQRWQLMIGLIMWFASIIFFWHWWLDGSHIITWLKFLINTLVVAWGGLLPIYYFFFLWRAKKPNPKITIPDNFKVAMVVTKTPSAKH